MFSEVDELLPRVPKTLSNAQDIIHQKTDQKNIVHRNFNSVKNTEQLEKIFLKDLNVNRIHLGKYLICRLINQSVSSNEINKLVVEDELNEVENVFLADIIPITNFMPNYVYIIKEPNFVVLKDNFSFILVESPTDIQTLFNHTIIKWQPVEFSLSADELNLLGNQSFSNKDFSSAIKFYSWALEKKLDDKILTNRAAAYLNLNFFYESSQDCKISIEINSKNEKAFFRLAKCFYQMRQFDLALEALEKCVSLNTENLHAFKELARTKKRLMEAKTGDYDFKTLINACQDKVLRHDIADFVSDKISLDREKNFLKAKTDIKRGTLLLCEKAASIWYKAEKNSSLTKVPKIENFKLLISQLEHDPYLLKKIYQLSQNKDEFDEKNFFIDLAKLNYIVNKYSFQSPPVQFCSNFKPEPNELEVNSGIWIQSAFIKHSCLPNTKKIYFNDVLMVYASKDINENEFITTSYTNNTDTYQERSRNLEEYGISECDCELCKMDRADPQTTERDLYIIENKERIKKLVDQDSKDVNEGLIYFDKIKEMYKNRSYNKLCLAPALNFCASLYRNKGKLNKSAKIYADLFELCKDFEHDLAVYGLVEAINDYFLWFDMDNAKEFFKKFKEYSLGHSDYFMHLCDAKIIDYENIHQLLY